MRKIGPLLAKLGWTPEGHRRQGLPVVCAAQAQAGQVVKIRGRVAASEEGTLVGPFSGRPAVALQVQYLKHSPVPAETDLGVGRHILDEWIVELEERKIVPFWVADDTARALVLPAEATFMAALEAVQIPASMRILADTFLRERRVMRGNARTLEAIIAPGDVVEVIGPARRESLEHGGGYRDSALPTLVLHATEGPEGALTIQKLS